MFRLYLKLLMNSIPTLPTFTDLSLCSRPIPKIFTEVDITNWIDSQAFHSIQILIQRLNYAVHGLKVEQECTESEVR